MATQRFGVGDIVVASPAKGIQIYGTVSWVGSDGSVEITEPSGSAGMYAQYMVTHRQPSWPGVASRKKKK
jgi:hypothetical protein